MKLFILEHGHRRYLEKLEKALGQEWVVRTLVELRPSDYVGRIIDEVFIYYLTPLKGDSLEKIEIIRKRLKLRHPEKDIINI